MKKKTHILAIVGMAGAGKTAVANYFRNKGIPVLRFGSVIDEGLQEEGIAWSAESNKYYREKIRHELGMAAIAIKMLPKIEDEASKNELVILDGLYSWEEFKYLKELFPELKLLCVWASPEVRHERLSIRKERTFTKEAAHKRDIDEIEGTNKGGPIALADYLVINNTTIEDLNTQIKDILKEKDIWNTN